MWIAYIMIGSLIGCLGVYFYLRPKLKTVQEYDEATAATNYELQIELASLTARKEEISRSLIDLEEQAKLAREHLVKQNKALAEEQFEKCLYDVKYYQMLSDNARKKAKEFSIEKISIS